MNADDAMQESLMWTVLFPMAAMVSSQVSSIFYLTCKAFNALDAPQMATLMSAPTFVIVGGMTEYPLTAEQVEVMTGGKPNLTLQYHCECQRLGLVCPI
jgi:hypothetical protein